jgi:hypothetical protein
MLTDGGYAMHAYRGFLVFLLLAPAGVSAQSPGAPCSSHDHPCRVAMAAPTECQVCHIPTEAIARLSESGTTWKTTAAGIRWSLFGNSRFADQLNPPMPHSRTCLSCHDGGFAPRAEACPRLALVMRPVRSMTRGMDCGVCHDPHLDNRVVENAKFLHHEERCTDCHEGPQFRGLEASPRTG